jgi:UDP-N-acetyl-D-glucosamine dehydrogenase
MSEQLMSKIKNKNAKVAIVGLGYVGLPLAVEMAKEGIEVIGIDVDQRKCDSLNSGKSYIEDISNEELKPLTGKTGKGFIHATTDFSVLKTIDCVSICVPTPLAKTRDPDMSYILAVNEQIKKYIHPNMLIILESTTYPGTTDEIIVPMVEEAGYKVGESMFVCFSPERIDPGNKKYQLRNTPKVIGGCTKACTDAGVALYGQIVDKVVPVSSTRVAEMAKLLENTYRSINIGFANELAKMCHVLGIDTNEVISAAATKPFGFTPFYPGPGLGGHCIPIDPLYLSWKLKELNYNAKFIELAADINTSMPEYVIELTMNKLNDMEKSLKGANVLMLGISYKENISDMRESPAVDVFKLFKKKGAKVTYHDPHVPTFDVDHHDGVPSKPENMVKSVALNNDTIKNADIVVITTWHKEFSIDPVLEYAKAIVDTRNATKGVTNSKVVRI